MCGVPGSGTQAELDDEDEDEDEDEKETLSPAVEGAGGRRVDKCGGGGTGE